MFERMAGTTGLEPAASAVTGQRSNQLNYVPTRQIYKMRNNQCLAALHDLHIVHCLRGMTRIAPIPVRAAHRPPVRNHEEFHNQSYRNSFSENAKGYDS